MKFFLERFRSVWRITLTLKVRFLHFLTTQHNVNWRNMMCSFWSMLIFDRELTKYAVSWISMLLLLSKWNFFNQKSCIQKSYIQNSCIQKSCIQALIGRVGCKVSPTKSCLQKSCMQVFNPRRCWLCWQNILAWVHISCKILLISLGLGVNLILLLLDLIFVENLSM